MRLDSRLIRDAIGGSILLPKRDDAMNNKRPSIEPSSKLVDAAHADGSLFNCSIGEQVEHWVNVGRAVEIMPGLTLNRMRSALDGNFDATDLSEEEAVIFDDLLGAAMDGTHTAAARVFWAGFAGQLNTDL